MQLSPFIDIQPLIINQLKEVTALQFSYGTSVSQKWFGKRPILRIVRRVVKEQVRLGNIEGPHQRYYVSCSLVNEISLVCYIIDTERLVEYSVLYNVLKDDGYYEYRRSKVEKLIPERNSVLVEGCTRPVHFNYVEKLYGPEGPFGNPVFKLYM